MVDRTDHLGLKIVHHDTGTVIFRFTFMLLVFFTLQISSWKGKC